MNFSEPFIRRPVMTTLVMLSILLAGILAYIHLPVTDLPPITHPCIEVHTEYPGADPQAILNQITIPLEGQLALVKGVQEVSSRSDKDGSSIKLTFDLNKNMNQAAIDVQTAINRAEYDLPKDLEARPTYHLQESENEPIMFLLATSLEADIGKIRQIGEKYLLPRLERIEGVARVEMYGEKKMIFLQIDPEKLAARGLTFTQVIDAVTRNVNHDPLGALHTGTGKLAIEMNSSVTEAHDLESIHIGNQGVLFKDIGAISEKEVFPREDRFLTRDTIQNVLIIGIQKTSDANTIAISRDVQAALLQVQKELPKSIQLQIWFDKATWIHSSLTDVEWSLALAFVLVIIVITLSLKRIANSFITGLCLPFSLLGTLAIMYCLQFSIDLLSLVALTLSCGFVVDDAIVVLENIVRYREKGNSKKDSSILGTEHICFTILSITLSLVAVFVPLLFMPGMEGRLFREFSMTLAIAIVVSGAVSICLNPMLCSRFVQATHAKQEQPSLFKTAYAHTLRYVLNFPKTVCLCALFCLLSSIYLFTKLPVNLFPEEDRGYFFTIAPLAPGHSQSSVKELQSRLETILQKHASIDNFLSFTMPDAIAFCVRLRQKDTGRPPQKEVIADLERQAQGIPGVMATFSPWRLITLGMNFEHPGNYKLVITGTEYDSIVATTRAIATQMRAMPEVSFVDTSVDNEIPFLHVELDEKKAHEYGIDRHDVRTSLRHAFGRVRAGFVQHGPYREDIALELLPEYQKRLDAPAKLWCSSRNGSLVPLRACARFEEKIGVSSIHRHEGLPSAHIYFSLSDTVPMNIGLDRVEQKCCSLITCDTTKATLTGVAQTISSTMRNTLLLLLAATFVMYTILGILYESFIHPLTILSSIPLAGLGGILTLFITNEPLSIFSAVGFLLLIGIVKKNGIMMVDYALEIQKSGCSPKEAIIEACLVRFRPIMMTTVAAIMGALPLAIGIGESAEMLRGLGLVIVGGLLFSQVLTLYITPVLYVVFSRARR